MCDQVTKSKVEAVITDFVSKGFMFTAWDITKFLRKGGDRISHRDVQDAVKEVWNSGDMVDYTRDTKDVGAPVAPFVYYHQNSDIINYQSDWMENNSTQNGMMNDGTATVPTSAPVSASVPVSGATISPFAPVLNSPVRSMGATSVTRIVTDEGRLNVPIKMLEAAGFPVDSYVTATVNPNMIVIENKNPSFGTGTGAYDVSTASDGRIRLSRVILNKIHSGDKFKIERTGTKIVVTPA